MRAYVAFLKKSCNPTASITNKVWIQLLLDFRYLTSVLQCRNSNRLFICLSSRLVFGKHFSSLRHAYGNAGPNLRETPMVMWNESYKNAAYFYFFKYFHVTPICWAVGLSEMYFGSETYCVFINIIISVPARLIYWFYLLFILYISHWKETIITRMFLENFTGLELETPKKKKSSEKNNSRMQCSISGVLPRSRKILVRRFFPQGKTKGFFWFFHAAVWH